MPTKALKGCRTGRGLASSRSIRRPPTSGFCGCWTSRHRKGLRVVLASISSNFSAFCLPNAVPIRLCRLYQGDSGHQRPFSGSGWHNPEVGIVEIAHGVIALRATTLRAGHLPKSWWAAAPPSGCACTGKPARWRYFRLETSSLLATRFRRRQTHAPQQHPPHSRFASRRTPAMDACGRAPERRPPSAASDRQQ